MGKAGISPAVGSYVDEVRPDLWGPFWMRRRIEAELADHLMEAVARSESEGMSRSEAERAAVERFGTPAEIARAFARSKGVGVPTRFTKWSGLALLVGLPLFIAAGVYARISWDFSTGWYAEIAAGAGALILVGLVGMYLRLRGQLGRLGRNGFRALLGGFVTGAVSSAFWFLPGAIVGLALMAAGAVTYLYAMFKTSVFPRAAYALVAIGSVGAAITGAVGAFTSLDTEWIAGPLGYVLGAGGLMLIGGRLWREVPEDTREAPRAAPA